ncbi:MAG: type II toxin-antitoxin system YafQ family toxin, partial [Proteobacteria bacterium]|nr:type II toxin-antitoxin system YafQ family toxin [Pseudomonadota bacterium]
ILIDSLHPVNTNLKTPSKPDLVLIYRKPDNKTLELVRLGSHSELSL